MKAWRKVAPPATMRDEEPVPIDLDASREDRDQELKESCFLDYAEEPEPPDIPLSLADQIRYEPVKMGLDWSSVDPYGDAEPVRPSTIAAIRHAFGARPGDGIT